MFGRTCTVLLVIVSTCALTACAGAPRSAIPPAQGTPVTVGDWQVTTGGRVRVDSVYVGS